MMVQGISAAVEDGGPFWGGADRLGISWPFDI
jgi:hypothetical protein